MKKCVGFFGAAILLLNACGKNAGPSVGVDTRSQAPVTIFHEDASAVPSRPVPSKSVGSYNKAIPGFYLNHFDTVGVRAGCQDFGLNLSRGGQPDLAKSAWFEKLQAEDVGYVLDLRSEATSAEEKATLAKGLGYIWLPLNTSGAQQPSKIKYKVRHPGQSIVAKEGEVVAVTVEVLRLVNQLTTKGVRVYVHCARGEDRTGTIVGLLRKCDNWKTEFKNYGGSYYDSLKWLFDKVRTSGLTY